MKTKEWWFKDALNEKEIMVEMRDLSSIDELVKFYDGRLYQKEVDSPTLNIEWIPIKSEADNGQEKS